MIGRLILEDGSELAAMGDDGVWSGQLSDVLNGLFGGGQILGDRPENQVKAASEKYGCKFELDDRNLGVVVGVEF